MMVDYDGLFFGKDFTAFRVHFASSCRHASLNIYLSAGNCKTFLSFFSRFFSRLPAVRTIPPFFSRGSADRPNMHRPGRRRTPIFQRIKDFSSIFPSFSLDFTHKPG
jgi:hypothetical protein